MLFCFLWCLFSVSRVGKSHLFYFIFLRKNTHATPFFGFLISTFLMRKYLLLSLLPLPVPLSFRLMPTSFPSPLFFPSPPPPPAFLFLFFFWAKIDSVVRKKLTVMADGPLWATPCYCPTNPVACNLLRSGIPKFCDSFLEMPFPIEIMLEMVTRCSTWLPKPIYFSIWVRYSPHHPELSSESLELGPGGTGAGGGGMGLNNLPCAWHYLPHGTLSLASQNLPEALSSRSEAACSKISWLSSPTKNPFAKSSWEKHLTLKVFMLWTEVKWVGAGVVLRKEHMQVDVPHWECSSPWVMISQVLTIYYTL